MNKEIIFNKYKVNSPDYHYRQIERKEKKYFNAYVLARYQIELELIDIILKRIKGKVIRILDVGCGDGVLFFLFNQKFNGNQYELYGIDPSDLALKIAENRNPKVEFSNSDAYQLPFNDNYFDLVISSDVIEHLMHPEKMLLEIQRVGKKKSFVIIGTPIKYTEEPFDKMHQREFFPKEFKEVLSLYFSGVKIIQSHKLGYLILYKKKMLIFKRKFSVYRYLINILTIYFHRNPFLKIHTDDTEYYSYMFGLGMVKKKKN